MSSAAPGGGELRERDPSQPDASQRWRPGGGPAAAPLTVEASRLPRVLERCFNFATLHLDISHEAPAAAAARHSPVTPASQRLWSATAASRRGRGRPGGHRKTTTTPINNRVTVMTSQYGISPSATLSDASDASAARLRKLLYAPLERCGRLWGEGKSGGHFIPTEKEEREREENLC